MIFLYKMLYKMVEACFGEKLRTPPDILVLDKLTNKPISAPKIPYDYKILIVSSDPSEAYDYANSLLLEPENWVFVDSKSDVNFYTPDKCEIHAIGAWYKDQKCQNLVNWASKHHYNIV